MIKYLLIHFLFVSTLFAQRGGEEKILINETDNCRLIMKMGQYTPDSTEGGMDIIHIGRDKKKVIESVIYTTAIKNDYQIIDLNKDGINDLVFVSFWEEDMDISVFLFGYSEHNEYYKLDEYFKRLIHLDHPEFDCEKPFYNLVTIDDNSTFPEIKVKYYDSSGNENVLTIFYSEERKMMISR